MRSVSGEARFCRNCPISGSFCGDILEDESNLGISKSSLLLKDQDTGMTRHIPFGGEFSRESLTDDEFDVVAQSLKQVIIRRVAACEKGVANPSVLTNCPAVDMSVLSHALETIVNELSLP